MKEFQEVYTLLRRKNRKQYGLLWVCCFFSVLLITAYVCMMRSPTILDVLPEGGDSRKQVMMIFVLAVIGCAVFTLYAASLFLRYKSRELGIFLALGAKRNQLKSLLMRELSAIALSACAAGALLGAPLALGLWQLFRLWVVDTEEMPLRFDPAAYSIALAFSLFVFAALLLMGARFVGKTKILDIIQASRKSEPIRTVPRWYGWGGLLLVAVGAVLGYSVPSFCVLTLHWYPPEGLTAIFYLPVLLGLYMLLLHTAVNGWGRKKQRYKNIIATSMMKFQGRQTVNNMLVMTLLIAGAYFASFYTPMLGVGAMMGYDARPVDYAYFYRNDQDVPRETEVRQLAEEYKVNITSYVEAPMIRLAVDGTYSIETEGKLGTTWQEAYREQLQSELFLSESGYQLLTGEEIDLEPGQIAAIMDAEGDGQGIFGGDAQLVTNPFTEEKRTVNSDTKLRNDVLFGRYVCDDADFAALSEGLTDAWRETMVFFNVEDNAASYDFAKALFNRIVDGSGPEVAVLDAWDPVNREWQIAEEGSYWYDDNPLSYDQRNSSEFRMFWKYMPRFQVLDKADFVKTTAVFILLFVFIAIVCFAAVFVIAYTRCMTIALNNRRVYEDLGKLGASRAYLYASVRGQVSRVFTVPAITGTGVIYAFYAMIMYANDGRLSMSEIYGMGACLLLILGVSLLLYAVYRLTLRRVCRALDI